MRQRSMGARSATDTVGYREMRAFAKRFPDRMWAIEGCNGIGRHRAPRQRRPLRATRQDCLPARSLHSVS
jgi:hypothetical protein